MPGLGNKSSKQALVAEVDQVLPSWLFHYDEEISAKSDLCIFYKNYEIFVGKKKYPWLEMHYIHYY